MTSDIAGLLQIVGRFLLAFTAGALNSWTLIYAGTFATVQSGNVASSGIWLATGEWSKFAFAFFSVLAFGIGSVVFGILMTSNLRRGRTYTTQALVILAIIVVVLAVLVTTGLVKDGHYHWIAYAVSFAAGGMGNAFHKNHGMLYGAVAVTFVVQMAFNFLVQAAFNKKGINGEPNLKWSGIFFLVLLGFSGGALVGSLIIVALGTDPAGFLSPDGAAHLEPVGGLVLLLPALVLLAIASRAAADLRKQVSPDPTPGGLIA